MVDRLTSEQRSSLMKSVKSSRTIMENKVSKELWRRGMRFRRNVKKLVGKPDFSIKKDKVVIFLDSCFWHMCPVHCKLPKSNCEFWLKKLQRNKERDVYVTSYYTIRNWNILRIWEHELKEDFESTINKIYDYMIQARKKRSRYHS